MYLSRSSHAFAFGGQYTDGLVQDCSIYIANAQEIL